MRKRKPNIADIIHFIAEKKNFFIIVLLFFVIPPPPLVLFFNHKIRLFSARIRHSPKFSRVAAFFFAPPPFLSHSCESRNLRRRIAAGNCTFLRLRRQFAPSARRFRLSPEWRCFLSLRTIPNSAVSENIKPPFRRKPESLCVSANKGGGNGIFLGYSCTMAAAGA
ncbi:MAG: hypothetical protein ACR2QC_01665 [Gammaproteobacteria bacterium]